MEELAMAQSTGIHHTMCNHIYIYIYRVTSGENGKKWKTEEHPGSPSSGRYDLCIQLICNMHTCIMQMCIKTKNQLNLPVCTSAYRLGEGPLGCSFFEVLREPPSLSTYICIYIPLLLGEIQEHNLTQAYWVLLAASVPWPVWEVINQGLYITNQMAFCL